MLSEIIKQLNWVDILTVTVIGRIVYIGFKNGVVVEFFKCLGTVFAVFLSFHYFSDLAKWIESITPLAEPTTIAGSFSFIALLVLLSFKFVRDAVLLVFKPQTHPVVDRWIGFFIAVFRSFLTVSLILVIVNMLVVKEEKENLKQSLSFHTFFGIAPSVYHGIFGALHKVFPEEKINLRAFSQKSEELIVTPAQYK